MLAMPAPADVDESSTRRQDEGFRIQASRLATGHLMDRRARSPLRQRLLSAAFSSIRVLTIFLTSAAGMGLSGWKRSVPFPEK
jgi:hypothetical protein